MTEQNPNWALYANVVRKHCFDCINSTSRVLEIGPSYGLFTKVILDQNPSYVEAVEPDPTAVSFLKKNYGDKINILQKNIFELLENEYDQSVRFDVVVAFGVLYHWHSPFDFLEKIANKIKPRYICLDNPDNDKIIWKPEITNAPGNFWTDKKTVGISLHLPPDVISLAVRNLGYKQLLKRDMSYFKIFSKEQSIIWKFERQQDDI